MEIMCASKESTSSHNQNQITSSAPKMPEVKTERIISLNPVRRRYANQWSISEVRAIGAPLTLESLNQLMGPLDKGNNGARTEAIYQIGMHASSDALRERCVAILSFVLRYKGDWKDRREAAIRLGQIPCLSAEKALEEAANDIRTPVREQVARSLCNLRKLRSDTREKNQTNL